jgi:GT2 family glycosyltransferase
MERMMDGKSTAGCMVTHRRQRAEARAAAEAFAQHHPRSTLYVLGVDCVPNSKWFGERTRVLGLDDLPTSLFADLACTYQVSELCSAIKPTILQHLFNRFDEERIVLFDPEVMVYRPLTEVEQALASHDIVLTPHLLRPLPFKDRTPNDRDVLRGGAYAESFIGVKRSDQTGTFLAWWHEHILKGEGAIVGEGPVYYPHGLITARKWLDLAPTLFPGVHLLRDAAYNVSWWNLTHRLITRHDGVYRANGRPLSTFLFAGFDPYQPTRLTSHFQDRVPIVEGTPLARLLAEQATRLLRFGYAEAHVAATPHATIENGIFGNFLLRQLYLTLSESDRQQFGSISDEGRSQRFVGWAKRMNRAGGSISPFLRMVFQLRPDLAEALPDIDGADRDAFLEWAGTHGSRELGYSAALACATEADSQADCPDFTPHQLVRDIRTVVRGTVSETTKIAVFCDGLPHLRDELHRTSWTFPQDARGNAAGAATPGDVAVDQLESMRAQGAAFLVLPRTSWKWLEDRRELRDHLRRRYSIEIDEPSCLIYRLDEKRYDHLEDLALPRYAPMGAQAIQAKAPECSIVIPVHGKSALTKQCLDRLLTAPFERTIYEIIVADDASPDNTLEVLAAYADRIRLVRHRKNQGFARTCNDGASVAGGRCLVFLNNDTIPQPGWLDALVAYQARHPRAGAVGSKLLYPNGTIQHAGTIFLQDRWPRHVYVGFPGDHPAVNRSRRFQAVTAASLLMPRDCFEELGGFDPDFINSYEDVDLCLRLGERGWESHYCHESVLYHLESVTRQHRTDEDEYNAQVYYRRWGHRVKPDDLQTYWDDGLISVEREPGQPPRLRVSPYLATPRGGNGETRSSQIVYQRSQQMFELLKENIRLNVGIKEAELGANGRSAADGARAESSSAT